MGIRIITDSAADFSSGELKKYQIGVVPLSVNFGTDTYLDGVTLTPDVFWNRLFAGENPKTSQPSPDMFLSAFEEAKAAGDSVVCICVSSALSGTAQSAAIAASMAEGCEIHIVDSMSVATAEKLLALHACRLRDEGHLSAREIAQELKALRSRIHLYASLDTLENLARSGRISKAAASIGTLAQLKPLVKITPDTDGHVEVCGKAIGRHRAIDAIAKLIDKHSIDERFPVMPIYTYSADNCAALVKKLRANGIAVSDELLSALGPTLATHIGPNAYGIAFVAAE